MPYRFSETEVYAEPNSETRFIDLDGDGIEARVTITFGESPNAGRIVSTRYNGTTISSIPLPPARSVRYQFAQDVDNDGYTELFLISEEQDSCYALIVSAYAQGAERQRVRKLSLRCVAPHPKNRTGSETFELHGLVQYAREESPVIIASHTTGEPSHPSYVFAIDALTGRFIWSYGLAPRPEISPVGLPSPPTRRSMLLGTTSTGTHRATEETDDAHTYAIALGPDGRAPWPPRIIGGAFGSSRLFLHDIDGSGEDEILCFFSSSNRLVEQSSLRILKSENGAEITTAVKFPVRIILPDGLPVLKHGQSKYLVVCTYAGLVSLLDHDFKTVRQQQLPSEVTGFEVVNVVGDEELEIVISLRSGVTAILGQSLEPLAAPRATGLASIERCNSAAEPRLVLASGSRVTVGTLTSNTGPVQRFLFLGSAFLAILVVGFIAYRGFLYITVFRSSAANSRDIPIVLLSRRGKVLMANPAFCAKLLIPPGGAVGKRWQRILSEDYHRPLREALSRIPSDLEPHQEQVKLATPAFNGTFLLRIYPARSMGHHIGTFITMHDISRVLRNDQLVNWASIAHSMAHEMKTPLSTIWFTLARIRQELADGAPGHVEAHLASIEEEVRRVDNYIKGFMKLANINPPNVQRTDLNATVREVLNTYRTKLPESTLVETDLSEDLPAIELDVHLFTVAMRNILDNAISAMKGKGILKVSTYLVRNLNASTVYFSLSDTGSGIAPEDVPKVFEPYFSKADGGTGLGLVITKKIIEDHGGSIALTSQRGLGTEVVIQLPVSRGAGGTDHDS